MRGRIIGKSSIYISSFPLIYETSCHLDDVQVPTVLMYCSCVMVLGSISRWYDFFSFKLFFVYRIGNGSLGSSDLPLEMIIFIFILVFLFRYTKLAGR